MNAIIDSQKKDLILHRNAIRENCDKDNKKTLNNACRELSIKLYEAKAHFYYELIQNAEDNNYKSNPSFSEPEISFFIDQKGILVQNNEMGFQEKDIISISDIGESGKEKSENRHDIGEKGIGFKSVFGISDTPQIFSNGYRFQFNANEPLGFIKPTWIDRENIPKFIDLEKTNIYLPLKKEVLEKISDLEPINPKVILFLKKVKKINFNDKLHNIQYSISKQCQDTNFILLEKKNTDTNTTKETIEVQKYKIFEEIYVKPIGLEEELRAHKKTSKLEIAFPIKLTGGPDPEKGGQVYSFLPLDSYEKGSGLLFIIQGDFLLTSNRASILQDNKWNQWLRSVIPDLIIKIIEKFKLDPELRLNFYAFLPSEKSIRDPFFAPIGPFIIQKVKNINCILDMDNEWKKPSDVLMGTDSIIELISNECLKKELGKSFVSNQIGKYPILEQLGIQNFTWNHFQKILEKTEWIKPQSLDWFLKLYRILGSMLKGRKISSSNLQSLAILKLENGDVCTPFAASQLKTKVFLHTPETKIEIIAEDVRYISPSISKESELDEDIAFFFKALEIFPVTPNVIIKQIIIPFYETSQWKKVLNESDVHKSDLSDSILFLYKNSSIIEKDDWNKLKKAIVFKIRDQVDQYLNPSELYLPIKYQPQYNIELLFEKSINKPTFLSEDYLTYLESAEIPEFQDFVLKLGINSIFLPQKRKVDKYDIKDKSLQNILNSINYVNYIDDYDFNPTLEDLINQKNITLITNWFTYLDIISNKLQDHIKINVHTSQHWKTNRHSGYYENDIEIAYPTTWLKTFREIDWVPTKDGRFLKPSEVYASTKEIVYFSNLAQKNLPFLALPFKNIQFLTELQVKSVVTISFLIDILRALRDQNKPDLYGYSRIYEYLWENFSKSKSIIESSEKGSMNSSKIESNENDSTTQTTQSNELKTFFSNEPLIFLPYARKKFFTIEDVMWKIDESKKHLNAIWGVVSLAYPSLYDFFVKSLGVIETPKSDDYKKAILNYIKTQKNTTEISAKSLNLLVFLFSELNHAFLKESNGDQIQKDEQWILFFKNPIYYTTQKQFECNEDNLFINNEDSLFELFQNDKELRFWNIAKANNSNLMEFARIANIRCISKAVEIKLNPDLVIEDDFDLTLYIRNYFPYLLRFLYSIQSLVIPETISTEKFMDNLLLFQSKQATILQFTFTITNIGPSRISITHTTNKDYLLFSNILYHRKNLLDLESIGIYLAEWIENILNQSENFGLDDFLIHLFEKKTSDQIELYLNKKRIYTLPESKLRFFSDYFNEIGLQKLFDQDILPKNGEIDDDIDDISIENQKNSELLPDFLNDSEENIPQKGRSDLESSELNDSSDEFGEEHEFNHNDYGQDEENLDDVSNSNRNSQKGDNSGRKRISDNGSLNDQENFQSYNKNPRKSKKHRRSKERCYGVLYDQENIIDSNDPRINPTISELPESNFPNWPASLDSLDWIDEEFQKTESKVSSQNRVSHKGNFERNNNSRQDKDNNKPQKNRNPPLSNDDFNSFDDNLSTQNHGSKSDMDDQNEMVGLWGEEFVFNMLVSQRKNQYPTGKILVQSPLQFVLEIPTGDIIKIIRDNPDSSEPRPSYDLIVLEPSKKYFIEVKSSLNRNKREFLISHAEWEFAKKTKEQYYIYRVEGALTISPNITIIPNPYLKWQNGEIVGTPLKIIY